MTSDNGSMSDSPDIGSRLRTVRQRRGDSLRQLARVAGVSPALIGHIETGRSTPSMNTLYALASALEISLDELFADPASTADVPHAPLVVSRHGERSVRENAGESWEGIATADQPLRFGILGFQPGASSTGDAEPVGHPGTEYGYVMAGVLDLVVGAERYVLRAGDSFQFDASTPHSLAGSGPMPTYLLWAAINLAGPITHATP